MGLFTRQELIFDKYRFGLMSVMIMIQSTYASIAAYMSIINGIWVLVGIHAVATMLSNAMFLAQAKPKICLIGFWASIILATIGIVVNAIIFLA